MYGLKPITDGLVTKTLQRLHCLKDGKYILLPTSSGVDSGPAGPAGPAEQD